MFDLKLQSKINSEFPVLNRVFNKKNLVYLDSACTALKIKSAIESEKNFLLSSGGCGGKRSVHLLSRLVEEEFSHARKTIADFIGAECAEEIIFTGSTTDAANLLATSFVFSAQKNEVLLSPLEHNSVFLPFYNLSKAGKIKLKIIPMKNLKPDFEKFCEMISKKTALVCLTHSSNVFGGIVDVKKFIDIAHLNNAKVFVDDAQYVGTHAENIRAIGADFLAFSGHKIGANFGTGVFYCQRNAMESLRHSKVGGGTIEKIIFANNGYKVHYLDSYAGFEPGIQNYSGVICLSEAIKFLSSIGFENIRRHVSDIVEYAYKKLSSFEEIKICGTLEDLKKSSIISLVTKVKDFSMADFGLFISDGLKDKVIAVRTGRHCADLVCENSRIEGTIRLSCFVYTTQKDIDEFCKALRLYLSLL